VLDDDAGVPGGDNTLSFQYVKNALLAGPYTITQDLVPGYVLTDIHCDLSQPGSSTVSFTGSGGPGDTAAFEPGDNTVNLNLAPDEGANCYFTDTETSADFTVHKDYQPDQPNGGPDVKVTLDCETGSVGGGAQTVNEDAPATFTVAGYSGDPVCTATEAQALAGYASSGNCSAALSAGGCTITNAQTSADFTVNTDYQPDQPNGGPDVKVTLACEAGTVESGAQTVNEDAPATLTVLGYAGDPVCTAKETAVPAGYTSSGSCAAALSAGHCTILNSKVSTGSITIDKLVLPLVDTGRFDLLIDGQPVATNVAGSGGTGQIGVLVGQHTVSERAALSPASPVSLDHYSPSIVCVSLSPEGSTIARSNSPAPGVPVVVDIGSNEHIVCVIINWRTRL
jgi:hypothetical protein